MGWFSAKDEPSDDSIDNAACVRNDSRLDRMRQLDHSSKPTRAETAELEHLLDDRRRGKF